MSAITLSPRTMDRISDWVNPILVKETRQALKSRVFIATYMLILVACWLICMMGSASEGFRLEYGTASRTLMQGFLAVLSIAALIVIPFNAFRSLLTEQDAQTYEVLSITSLSPRQIVQGKLLNSIVQLIVFYCAISPYVAFCSLLQGFDLARTSVVLVSIFGCSILLSIASLMLSTIVRGKPFQGLASLFLFGGLISGYSMIVAFCTAMMQGEIDLDAEFYWGWACVLLAGFSYYLLFAQITVSQLMFETANKSFGIRLIATLQYLIAWVLVLLYDVFVPGRIDDDLLWMLLMLSLIHWAGFGYYISMERDYLSRRVRRELPQNGLLRLLVAPLMPGGTRGYLLTLLNMGLLLGIIFWIDQIKLITSVEYPSMIIAIWIYVVMYLGIGCLVSRWLLRVSRELQPIHGRTILIILFAMFCIVPYFFLWMAGVYEDVRFEYFMAHIMNPFETVMEITELRGSGIGGIMSILWLIFLVVFGLNLIPMLRSIREIVFPKRPQTSQNL